MERPTIRVMMVDDNRRITSAWERLLARQPDMTLVGTLGSADGLLEAARAHRPHVVLIDLTMEGRDALEAITELSRELADIRTLVYSGLSRSEWHAQVTQAGARDFLDKAEDPMVILEAIRKCCVS